MEAWGRDGCLSVGVNCWASRSAIRMRSEWDAASVEEDFRVLAAHRVQTVRVFPLWPVFQPLKALFANEILYEYRMTPGEQPLSVTEAGRAGVSEEACKHFAELCALAEKYHLKLIVALLTRRMSFRFFAPDILEGKNILADPTVIKWELRFVRYFVKRFRDEHAIAAWELGNEST